MGTRGWQRGFVSTQFNPGQAAQVFSPFVIGETFSNTTSDTLLRVLIDAHCLMRLRDTDAPSVSHQWWAEMIPYVCAGRGVHPGDTPLEGGFSGDERITATGTLGLVNLAPSLNATGQTVARYESRLEIESQGQRKPLPGGGQPTVNATVGVINGTGAEFLDTLVWQVVWFVWIRSLWETP